MKGQRIKTLHHLHNAAIKRQSVVCLTCIDGSLTPPKPAAFVINQMGETILRQINRGMFVYKKRVDEFTPTPWERRAIKNNEHDYT